MTDDFSVLNNRLDLLLKLREHYPKLKVSLFTIPFDYTNETNPAARIMRDKTLEMIKDQLDWIEIIPHGLLHLPREMGKYAEFENMDYKSMREKMLPAIHEAFRRDDLPYVKGFKAPYWMWNEQVVKALDDEGWWGAVDRHQPKMPRTKKYYEYTHGIDMKFYESTNDVLKLHGHITPTNNGIERCFANLLKMPTDAKFVFASELLEEK